MIWLMRLALISAIFGALFAGEQYIEGIGYDKRAVEDAKTVAALRDTAQALREQLTLERRQNEAALRTWTKQLEKERATHQTETKGYLDRLLAGPGLRYTTAKPAECGRSGGGSKGRAADPSRSAAASVVQLPDEISRNLFKLLGDAESLKVDYGVLYTYVNNPKLVCELTK